MTEIIPTAAEVERWKSSQVIWANAFEQRKACQKIAEEIIFGAAWVNERHLNLPNTTPKYILDALVSKGYTVKPGNPILVSW